jgi:hypothetical protein
VVALQSVAAPGVDGLLESTVPVLDGARAVVDLYAEATGRILAAIYYEDPAFRAEWHSGLESSA